MSDTGRRPPLRSKVLLIVIGVGIVTVGILILKSPDPAEAARGMIEAASHVEFVDNWTPAAVLDLVVVVGTLVLLVAEGPISRLWALVELAVTAAVGLRPTAQGRGREREKIGPFPMWFAILCVAYLLSVMSVAAVGDSGETKPGNLHPLHKHRRHLVSADAVPVAEPSSALSWTRFAERLQ